jgi:hypothetical protein
MRQIQQFQQHRETIFLLEEYLPEGTYHLNLPLLGLLLLNDMIPAEI